MSVHTTVIFVHGMGKAPEGYSDRALDFLKKTYARLRPGQPLQVDRVEFCYDDVFEEFRKSPQNALEELGALPETAGLKSFITELSQSQGFVYTHVLDVLLWRFHSHVRSVITTDLAAKLTPLLIPVAKDPDENLVIIPFSLGTAVMNEVIHCVASTGATRKVKIPAIHMLANVSKVLERPELRAYSPPTPSLCRPDTGSDADRGSALQHYFTYWNRLDPIPQVDRFKPAWTEGDQFHDIAFTALSPKGEIHDLDLYLQIPEVYMRILRSISRDEGLTKEMELKEVYTVTPAVVSPAAAAKKAILDRVFDNFDHTSELGDFLKMLRVLIHANLI